jgi:surface antigen
LQTQPRSWIKFQRYNVVSFVVSTCFIVACGLGLFGVMSRAKVEGARERSLIVCSHTDRTHIVVGEETLASIAAHYDLTTQRLVAYNRLSAFTPVYINQSICIPSLASRMLNSAILVLRVPETSAAPLVIVKHTDLVERENRVSPAAPVAQTVTVSQSQFRSQPIEEAPYAGSSDLAMLAPLGHLASSHNAYPFGQCTWWAAQRYYQLHNVSVPWTMNSNAGAWVGRALQFGWHVSSVPMVGSILVLHRDVQGASSAGHVAIVEQILSNGTVIASSMNWGKHPDAVTHSLFHPGYGVSFIH